MKVSVAFENRAEGKVITGDLLGAERVGEWELKLGDDGASSGQAEIKVQVNKYPLKELPWEKNIDRPFTDQDHAVMDMLKTISKAYQSKDFSTLANLPSLKEQLSRTSKSPPAAKMAEISKSMGDRMAQMAAGDDYKPVPLDEKSVVIEKIEGVNLVYVHSAKPEQVLTGLTNGKTTAGLREMFLTNVDGKWVKVPSGFRGQAWIALLAGPEGPAHGRVAAVPAVLPNGGSGDTAGSEELRRTWFVMASPSKLISSPATPTTRRESVTHSKPTSLDAVNWSPTVAAGCHQNSPRWR